MAEYRTIKMSFWTDPFVESLSPEEKLLYLFLFTCPYTNALGVCSMTVRKISFETGLTAQAVSDGIKNLVSRGKLIQDGDQILIKHFIKHQCSTSPKLEVKLKKDFSALDSSKLRKELRSAYPSIFSADTVSEDENNNGYHIDTVSEDENTVSKDKNDTVSIPYQYPSDTKEQELKQEIKQELNLSLKPELINTTTRARETESEEGERENFSPDELPTEFLELRDYYDEHCRPEPPIAGYKEYKAIRLTKLWPGILRIYDDIDKRLEAKHYDKGYWPGLGKYLNQSTWRGAIVPRGEKPAANDWTVSETSWEKAAREKAQKELDQQRKNNKKPDNESSIGSIWDGMKGKYKVGNGEGD